MSEWISVNDRNPSSSDVYFICLINNIPCVGYTVRPKTIFTTKNTIVFCPSKNTWTTDELYGKITHWMPLPKPPEDLK
jgi:hypothetical protein